MGYDVLWKYARKWKIDPSEWVALCPNGYTGLFLYKHDVSKELIACKRWLESGGRSMTVHSNKGNRDEGWVTDIEDFVKQNGKVKPFPSGLLKPGHEFIKALNRIDNIFSQNRQRAASSAVSDPRQFNETLYKVLPKALDRLHQCINKYHYLAFEVVNVFDAAAVKYDLMPTAWMQKFKDAQYVENKLQVWRDYCEYALSTEDAVGVERTIFSHFSIKNAIHQAVRAEQQDSWRDRMESLFGNLALADSMMGPIGANQDRPSNIAQPQMTM
jgi:hypothetical protein